MKAKLTGIVLVRACDQTIRGCARTYDEAVWAGMQLSAEDDDEIYDLLPAEERLVVDWALSWKRVRWDRPDGRHMDVALVAE